MNRNQYRMNHKVKNKMKRTMKGMSALILSGLMSFCFVLDATAVPLDSMFSAGAAKEVTISVGETRTAVNASNSGDTKTASGALASGEQQTVASVSDNSTADSGAADTTQAKLPVIMVGDTTVDTQSDYGYTNLGIAHVDNHLNVRKEPKEDGEIVGKMPKKAGCEILSIENGWAKIKSGKVEGYVSEEFLYTGDEAQSIAEEVKIMMATVNTMTLKVRTAPSLNGNVITLIPEGEELEVLEDTGDWVKIAIDDEEGFISKEFVDIAVELDKAVTLTELNFGGEVSDTRISLINFAKKFVGNPYVWGGTSLENGADCSGFVMSVFKNYGVSLPHSSRAQAGCGTGISLSEAKPGDLVFYGNGSTINHVAIYIGGGQVVHASSARTGIKISNATYRTPLAIRRIL